jgi:hypothetical protein
MYGGNNSLLVKIIKCHIVYMRCKSLNHRLLHFIKLRLKEIYLRLSGEMHSVHYDILLAVTKVTDIFYVYTFYIQSLPKTLVS